jgi:hypothetical protein
MDPDERKRDQNLHASDLWQDRRVSPVQENTSSSNRDPVRQDVLTDVASNTIHIVTWGSGVNGELPILPKSSPGWASGNVERSKVVTILSVIIGVLRRVYWCR